MLIGIFFFFIPLFKIHFDSKSLISHARLLRVNWYQNYNLTLAVAKLLVALSEMYWYGVDVEYYLHFSVIVDHNSHKS